jgi:hypothetical protein
MEMHVTNLKCPTKAKSNYSSSIVVNADLNHNHENDERKNERQFIRVSVKRKATKKYIFKTTKGYPWDSL